MIKNFYGIQRIWLFSSETNPAMPLGKLMDIVIDPNTGKCEAFWVQTLDGLRLIDMKDIHRWGKNEIYVSSQKDILKPEEFPRITPILEREVPIISAKVFVREGKIPRKIGKVKDLAFQTNSLLLLGILVNTGWWIFGKKIDIPRARILEITEDGIFITNNLIKVEEKPDTAAFPSTD
jgi:uncharacterized protein YrrD